MHEYDCTGEVFFCVLYEGNMTIHSRGNKTETTWYFVCK